VQTLQRLSNNANVPANEVVLLQKELAESKTMVEHYQIVIRELGIGKELLTKKQVELESNYGALESEYEALLEKAVTEEEQQQETLSSHKTMLEQKYAAKRESHAHEIEDLKKQIAWKDQQEGKLAVAIAELKMANEELQVRKTTRLRRLSYTHLC
jgi:kinesin family protein 5